MNFPLRSAAAVWVGLTGSGRRASVSAAWILLAALALPGTISIAVAQPDPDLHGPAHPKDSRAADPQANSDQAAAEGEPESTPDFDLAQLQQLLKREHSSSADFTEKQYRKVLSRPVESKGVLRFQPPNVFERQVLTPRAEKYRIVGETLTMETPGRKVRKVSLRSQPLLRALLVGFQAVVSGATTERSSVASPSSVRSISAHHDRPRAKWCKQNIDARVGGAFHHRRAQRGRRRCTRWNVSRDRPTSPPCVHVVRQGQAERASMGPSHERDGRGFEQCQELGSVEQAAGHFEPSRGKASQRGLT